MPPTAASSTCRRRSARAGRRAFGGLWNTVIPGLGPAASAVAFTQLRLGLRSPRGRSIMASPLLVSIIFVFITQRAGRAPIPGLDPSSGIGIGAFAVLMSILALMPFSMNQFAIDKAGFTRQMLSPLSVRDLLWGKATGNALIALIPATLGSLLPALMFRGPLHYWIALAFIGIATYVLHAPIAAPCRPSFPKTVDLNSIGNSGNAHQAAGLLGMLAFAASAAPGALIAVLAVKFLHRADLLLPLLLGWVCCRDRHQLLALRASRALRRKPPREHRSALLTRQTTVRRCGAGYPQPPLSGLNLLASLNAF